MRYSAPIFGGYATLMLFFGRSFLCIVLGAVVVRELICVWVKVRTQKPIKQRVMVQIPRSLFIRV